MTKRWLSAFLCVTTIVLACWIGSPGYGDKKAVEGWSEVVTGVWRSPGLPAGYALVDGDAALLIDAPVDAEALKARGIHRIDAVLLTHHHRDTCAAAGKFLADRVRVRAPKASAEWLLPDRV